LTLINGKRLSKWTAYLMVGLCLSLMVAAGVIKYTVGWFWTIPQNGMSPALPAGSSLFGINNPYRDVKEVCHGDIVVFRQSQDSSSYVFMWRVIGLPGETVKIDDARVSLNGMPLPLEKIRSQEGLEVFRETNGDVSYEIAVDRAPSKGMPRSLTLIVPDNHLFVMGDNRPNASDSRIMGPIPFGSVIAKKW
jgi:signal peptidase I